MYFDVNSCRLIWKPKNVSTRIRDGKQKSTNKLTTFKN